MLPLKLLPMTKSCPDFYPATDPLVLSGERRMDPGSSDSWFLPEAPDSASHTLRWGSHWTQHHGKLGGKVYPPTSGRAFPLHLSQCLFSDNLLFVICRAPLADKEAIKNRWAFPNRKAVCPSLPRSVFKRSQASFFCHFPPTMFPWK